MRYTILCAVVGILTGCGAFGPADIPDQSQFAPLADIVSSGRPFVRLYGDEIFPVVPIAIHLSFVFKPSGSADVQMWELEPWENGPYGHVLNIDLDEHPRPEFFATAFVIAEVFDDQAQSIADFIETQSPNYPCRFAYEVLGLNSNTYIEWVLRQTGWNVALSARAIGKDAAVNCP